MRVTSTRRPNRRRGVTIVEFAVVCTLCLMIFFGIFEFGRIVYVKQLMDNAAREGARYWAMNPNADPTTAVIPRVQAEAAPQVTLTSGQIFPSIPSFDGRLVRVDFTFTPVTPLISSLWGGGSRTLTTRALMPVMKN